MEQISIQEKKWVLLPLEVKNRELDAKVMLACIGAERGFAVLLGRNGFNLNKIFPCGVYFDKCISSYKEDVLNKQVNELGNTLVSLDEEGLIYETEQIYLNNRSSRRTVDLSTLIFTWGEAQFRMMSKQYDASGKIIATGSPRADLWKEPLCHIYKKEAEKILERIGDFILIPANFPPAHHSDPINFFRKHCANSGQAENGNSKFEYYQNVYGKFVELIPAIAECNRDITVVLRPHPNDNPKVWGHLKKSWPENVKVIHTGSVSSWIYASQILVHNNCTTGIEAFAMGKPTIAYIPHANEQLGHSIPNALSQQSNTVEGVLNLIEENLKNEGLGREEDKIELYNHHIKNKKNILAGDRIFDALEQLDLPETGFEFRSYGVGKKLRVIARKIKRRLGDVTGKNEFSYAYRKQKNPGISLVEIKDLIDNYRNNLNRWDNVLIEQVDEDLFCFFRES